MPVCKEGKGKWGIKKMKLKIPQAPRNTESE